MLTSSLGSPPQPASNAMSRALKPSSLPFGRLTDHLGAVMTARERHQVLALVNKMRKRIDQQAPPKKPDPQD
ncbi:MAG: hypothetical protein AUK55_11490 [Syntrophobacteraceae bacterium CG2_30_61_12]|nr:MAG: hypothetical protein AUK55_11490 [Syntrophobacteraceae bacterium CG2_30_61_12]